MFLIQLYNFIFGYVLIKITGEKPEKFINVLMQLRIKFWDVEKNAETNEITLKTASRYISDEDVFDKIAQKSKTNYEIIGAKGIKYFLIRYKYRLGIYAGAIIGAAIIYFSTFFVWDIKVVKSDYPNHSEIIEALERFGCKTGAYIPRLKITEIQARMLIENTNIAWIAVNIKGTVANVEVKRRDAPAKIADKTTPTNVVALKTGKVIYIEAHQGQKIAVEGDTVQKGDLLISGLIDSKALGARVKHASGRVFAETVRVIEVKIPMQTLQKEYTGVEINNKSLNIFGKNVNLYLNSGNSLKKYDKIKEVRNLSLFNAIILPIKVSEVTYREFSHNPVSIDESTAEVAALEKIDNIIEREFKEIEILSKEYEGKVYGDEKNSYYYLQCKLECIEDIAKEVPFDTFDTNEEIDVEIK